jgi:hypothetical protein
VVARCDAKHSPTLASCEPADRKLNEEPVLAVGEGSCSVGSVRSCYVSISSVVRATRTAYHVCHLAVLLLLSKTVYHWKMWLDIQKKQFYSVGSCGLIFERSSFILLEAVA